jgi:serine/threonine-protein kinase
MEQPPQGKGLRPGDPIGERYRVVRALGEGGMGAVYEAENTWTKRRVAIKVLLASVAEDSEQMARFRQEAQTATTLRHPNIIDVLDMGPDPATGHLFIVQELLVGRTLREHLTAKSRLTPWEAFDLIVPVMGALIVAHEKGVLHRDIKPENIFLAEGASGELVPKVIDFGLARLVDEDPALRKTRTGMFLGTPYYMAPEQARGETEVDARVDVWAVGAVLHEVISGAVLFDAANVPGLMWKIATETAPRLDAITPGVPARVADLVYGALKRDRDERYPSMRAFLDAALACPDLKGSAGESLRTRHARSIASMLPHLAETVPATPMPAEPASAPPAARNTPLGWTGERASDRRSSRNTRVIAGAVTVTLALAGGAVFLRSRASAPTVSSLSPVTAAPAQSPSVETHSTAARTVPAPTAPTIETHSSAADAGVAPTERRGGETPVNTTRGAPTRAAPRTRAGRAGGTATVQPAGQPPAETNAPQRATTPRHVRAYDPDEIMPDRVP